MRHSCRRPESLRRNSKKSTQISNPVEVPAFTQLVFNASDTGKIGIRMEAIYLAITKNGLEKAMQAGIETGATFWCGADTLSEAEFESHTGSALSRFAYSIDDEQDLEGALETIREHHPGAVIWVEAKS
jgi:hypothetical protein